MTEVKEYAPGTFCWVELAAKDAPKARSFYSQLFGWQTIDIPVGEGGIYTMLTKAGKNVCALYQMRPDMPSQEIPSHWQSYASVQDVDASADQARKLGGTVLEVMDVMEAGRMALVQDPTGAKFSLWQPKTNQGAELVNEPDTFCWNELQTKQIDPAIEFYTQLFGWTARKSGPTDPMAYVELRRGDHPMGGMLEIQEAWGEVPPNWMVYFAVADCDAALAKAQSLGAVIFLPPMTIPTTGRFAGLQDPQGAKFMVIQMEQPAS